MVKYQILLTWTLGAMSLAFLVRIIVLIKHRNEHNLRWTEYLGHGLKSGMLSGGLAYGAVVVLIAAMNGLAIDIEAIGETDKETLSNVALMAIFPTLFVMMAAVMTSHKNIIEIPKSTPPDETISRMLHALKLLIKHARSFATSVKEHRWISSRPRRSAESGTEESLSGVMPVKMDTPNVQIPREAS